MSCGKGQESSRGERNGEAPDSSTRLEMASIRRLRAAMEVASRRMDSESVEALGDNEAF